MPVLVEMELMHGVVGPLEVLDFLESRRLVTANYVASRMGSYRAPSDGLPQRTPTLPGRSDLHG